MDSNKPIILPAERETDRQTYIILAILGVLFCVLVLGLGVLLVAWIPKYVEEYKKVFPQADGDAKNGQIAFVSTRDGNPEIYIINTDGTGAVRLTDNQAGDYAPAWSPDGTKIAFYSERDGNAEIYVMNADGSGLTRLTDNPAHDYAPAWSPDGSKISFHSHRYQGHGRIFVMNADGSDVKRLTSPDWDDWSPVWSPDGTKILFNSSRYNNRDVWVMNADGSGMKNLTQDPADDWWPDWSPDGNQIVFHSDRDGGFSIYSMNSDGSEVLRLTSSTGLNYDPAWSLDGKSIAYTSDRAGNNDVWVMNADGSEATNLTNHPAQDWSPAWRPAGIKPLIQPTRPALMPTVSINLPKGGNLALHQITRSSNSESSRPSTFAVDGSTSTDWGSGNFPPQWIEVDLGAPATPAQFRMLVTQYPNGNTTHRILMRSIDGDFSEIHRFEQYTRSGQRLDFKLEQPLKDIQVVRIETLDGPSWVGWVEIEVIGER